MSHVIKEQGKFKYLEEGEGEVIVILHGLFDFFKIIKLFIRSF